MPEPDQTAGQPAKIVSLDQGVSWRTQDNRLLLIENMEPSHAARTCAWLERNAARFADNEWRHLMKISGDMSESAFDSIANELDQMLAEPGAWIRSTACWRALAKRAGAPRETWAK